MDAGKSRTSELEVKVLKCFKSWSEEATTEIKQHLLSAVHYPSPYHETSGQSLPFTGRKGDDLMPETVKSLDAKDTTQFKELSKNLFLNEKECLHYWQRAKSKEIRGEIERRRNLRKGTLDRNIGSAAKYLFHFDRMEYFNIVDRILKQRIEPETHEGFALSNELLKKDDKSKSLFEAILRAISIRISDYEYNLADKDATWEKLFGALPTPSPNSPPNPLPGTPDVMDEGPFLITAALTLFSICKSTVLLTDEVKQLLALMKRISDAVLDRGSKCRICVETRTMALSILQVCYVTALCSKVQERSDRTKSFDENLSMGADVFKNLTLPGLPDERCSGLHGFVCLVHALRASDERTKYLLLEKAQQRRAFTYVRLSILPLLESCFVDNEEALAWLMNSMGCFLDEVAEKLCAKDGFALQDRRKEGTDGWDDMVNLFASFTRLHPPFSKVLVRCNNETGRVENHPFFFRLAKFIRKEFHRTDCQTLLSSPELAFLTAGTRLLAAMGTHVVGSDDDNTANVLKCLSELQVDAEYFFGLLETAKTSFGDPTPPPGTYISVAGGLPAPTASTHRWQVTEAGAELLLATAELVASVGLYPCEMERSWDLTANPVTVIFDLVVGPLDIVLKGALFRALASIVSLAGLKKCEIHEGCDTEEPLRRRQQWALQAWLELENSDLIIPSANPTAGTGGIHGLRQALAIECDRGTYPTTEGFLALMESLLEHGVPDNLLPTAPEKRDTKGPGIWPYVEYIIDDILLKYDRFQYLPVGALGRAQRMRLCARGIRVLSLILQHYHLERVHPDLTMELPDNKRFAASDFPAFSNGGGRGRQSNEFSDLLARDVDLAGDFRSDQMYLLGQGRGQGQGQGQGQRRGTEIPLRKTCGFHLMAMTLNGTGTGPILHLVLDILGECSIDGLDRAARNMIQSSCLGSAAVLDALREFVVDPSNPHLSYVNGPELSTVLLGKEFGWVCDERDWSQRAASACVGFLYECCLRADTFSDRVRHAPQPLSYVRSECRYPVSVPLIATQFADVLTSSQKLNNVSEFLKLSPTGLGWITAPSMQHMVCTIMEHIATRKSARDLLGAMQITSGVGDPLTGACTLAIMSAMRDDRDSQLSPIRCTGTHALPLFVFTPLSKARSLSVVEAVEQLFPKSRTDEETKTIGVPDVSVSKMVLKLLLSTLRPVHRSLSHHLLGLSSAIEQGSAINDVDHIASTPRDCLEAILKLIDPHPIAPHPDPQSVGVLPLPIRDPDLACLCYKLLHRLCSDPITTNIILPYLRGEYGNFITKQISEFLRILRDHQGEGEKVDDGDLADGGARKLPISPKVACALHHCCAWTLQIAALDFRSISGPSRDRHHLNRLCSMLQVFLEHPEDPMGPSYSSSPPLPIVEFLQCGMNLFDSRFGKDKVSSQAALECIERATIPYIQTKDCLGTGPGAGPNGESEYAKFAYIDLGLLQQAIGEKIKEDAGVKFKFNKEDFDIVKAYNEFQMRMAAGAHVCHAWAQLISVAMLRQPLREAVFRQLDRLHQPDAIGKCVVQLLLPAVQTVTAAQEENRLDMIMGERVVPAILAIVAAIGKASASAAAAIHLPTISLSLSKAVMAKEQSKHVIWPLKFERDEEVLHALVRLLLGFGRSSNTSPKFRGFASSCLAFFLNPAAVAVQWNDPSSSYPSSDQIWKKRKEKLEEVCISLVGRLGTDATQAPLVTRLSTLPALTAVLHALGPKHGSSSSAAHEEVSAFITAVETLSGERSGIKDVLAPLLEQAVGPYQLMGATSAFDDAEAEREAERDAGLFSSTMALCIELARTPQGVKALCDKHLLRRLLYLRQFQAPLSPDTPPGDVLNRETQLLAALDTMQAMAFTSPTSANLLKGCLRFLRQNHTTVTHYLHLGTRTLMGLKITAALVSLLAAVAAVPIGSGSHESVSDMLSVSMGTTTLAGGASFSTMSKKQRILDDGSVAGVTNSSDTSWTSGAQVSPFDEILGHCSDSFTADICGLVRFIGSYPLPSTSGPRQGSVRSWWMSVATAPNTEHDRLLKESLVDPPEGLEHDGKHRWTRFDDEKLQHGLQILSQGCAFLRIRTSGWAVNTVGGDGGAGMLGTTGRGGGGYGADVFIPRSGGGDVGLARGLRSLRGRNGHISARTHIVRARLVSVDPSAVATAFLSCARLQLERQSHTAPSQQGSVHSAWLQGPGALSLGSLPPPSGGFGGAGGGVVAVVNGDVGSSRGYVWPVVSGAADSLITVLYTLIATATDAELLAWEGEMEACLNETKKFDGLTFVHEVGRWIRDCSQ